MSPNSTKMVRRGGVGCRGRAPDCLVSHACNPGFEPR